MFQKLQNKWKVSASRLLLIIATFAIGGSLCGYLGRKVMGFTNVDKSFLWVLLYLLVVTILWPICVIIISIPLGQFTFFKKYLKNISVRMRGKRKNASNINEQNINTP
ncbi:MAG: hypothetical protein LH615_09415 [Ferruginibacter sp.]|nr:hypothetical protein [Ferruginibacter sp.]